LEPDQNTATRPRIKKGKKLAKKLKNLLNLGMAKRQAKKGRLNMKQLNRMLLTATLLIGATFALILTPPVIAAIELLTEGN
jgi:hypothetical protein